MNKQLEISNVEMDSTLLSLLRSLAKILHFNTESTNSRRKLCLLNINMGFFQRRLLYLDSGFNAIKMKVLCWQVFDMVGGYWFLFLRERGRNLENISILTEDEKCARHLHKNTKNTSMRQVYKWN